MSPHLNVARSCGMIAIVASVLALGQPASADDERLPFVASRFAHLSEREQTLLREYHEAFYRLKAFYESCSMRVEELTWERPQVDPSAPLAVPGAEPELKTIWRYYFRAREGKYFRLDRESISPGDRETVTASKTGLIRPEGGYLLGYDLDASEHFLEAHGKDRWEYFTILYSHVFPFAAFCVQGVLLDEFLFHPESPWQVVSVELQEDDTVKVTSKGSFPRGEMTRTYWFLRSQHWALVKCHADSTSDSEDESTLSRAVVRRSYRPGPDGYPILTGAELETGDRNPEQHQFDVMVRKQTTVTSFSSTSPDLAEFDVGKLVHGFEEVGSTQSNSIMRWVFIGNGVALLLLSLLLARRSIKQRNVSQARQ
ncbi:MAG: hypothetical protein ACF8TS_03265 [Maioricimonas sp. JB049]